MPKYLNQEILLRMSEILGDKWALPIIGELMDGSKRFSQLQQRLSINPRTLTKRLKQLEAADFVARRVYAEVPPRVEYKLTEKGNDLSAILDAIVAFGEQYLPKDTVTDSGSEEA